MALYKDGSQLNKSESPIFDATHKPGTSAPYPGVYICTGCGEEIGIAQGHVLPPQDHHTHPPGKPPILWKLLVAAQHLAK